MRARLHFNARSGFIKTTHRVAGYRSGLPEHRTSCGFWPACSGTRRRRASMCYNGEQYERVEFRKNCPCAEEDYECDFGYERSTDNGPCVAVMAWLRA